MKSIEPGSPSARKRITSGSRLLRINGDPVRDELDLFFLSSDALLKIELLDTNGHEQTVTIRKHISTPLGIQIEPLKARRCRNRCIFCFIDQNPKGLRPALYLKDEDLRLSFSHGHYITTTGLNKSDLERIIAQRLSPLYISVHTTNPPLRSRMLQINPATTPDIMETLRFFAQHHVDFHAQIVLCPGWNDAAELDRTLDDLETLLPSLLTVAVVPIGLTAHREGLEQIEPMTPAWARKVVEQVEPRQKRLLRKTGGRVVLLADEIYLCGNLKIPQYSEEEMDAQIENGVGMVGAFWEGWSRSAGKLPQRFVKPLRVAILTGFLGARVLEPLAARLNRIDNLDVRVVGLENSLYGHDVNVSGLLSGADFDRGLSAVENEVDLALIPANALNADNLFLDDLDAEKLLNKRPGLSTEIISGGAMAIVDCIKVFGKQHCAINR